MKTTIKIILDKRATKAGNPSPLKLYIYQGRQNAMISLDVSVLPEQWDERLQEVKNHPAALRINTLIGQKKIEAQRILIHLMDSCEIAKMTAQELKKYIISSWQKQDKTPPVRTYVRKADKKKEHTVASLFETLIARHKTSNTAKRCRTACKKLREYVGETKWSTLTVEDIDAEFLYGWNDYLARTAPNANSRGVHMRHLMRVCNYARQIRATTYYPFVFYKIEHQTTRKRNFDVETLRRIFAHKCESALQQKYLDFLRLTFMLIGINSVDLTSLKEIRNGRIEYIRAKTKRPYNIKVEPETMELINQYRGQKQLLSYLDDYKNHMSFYTSMRKHMKLLKEQLGLRELTTYWMRHSWATIACNLDIPIDVIAQALGHGGHTVTDIYIERDPRKVDEANRRVLDWVLYGKDWREQPVKQNKD